MPPTVMTPWFTPCCGLCVVLVGAAGAAPLPPEPFAAGLAFPPAFPPAPVWAAGVAPRLATCALEGVLLLDAAGVGADEPLLGVAPPLGVAVFDPAGAATYDCPATAPAVGCTVAVPPRCAKSYAIAPPRMSVAM